MRAVRWGLVVVFAVLATSCGGGGTDNPAFDDPQEWGFNFYDAGTNTLQAVDLILMEATRNIEPGRIDIQIPGCTLVLNFDVQFSGSQVRLLLFRIAPESTCNGVQIAQAFGDGQANGSYGSATEVFGTGVIRYNSPIGPAGGDIRWEAFLQP